MSDARINPLAQQPPRKDYVDAIETQDAVLMLMQLQGARRATDALAIAKRWFRKQRFDGWREADGASLGVQR